MTLEEAKEEILKRSTELLEMAVEEGKYICPVCENGSKEGEKGVSTEDKIHFVCSNGCYEGSTILEILGKVVGSTKEEHMIKIAADQLGINIDDEEEKEETKELEKEDKKKTEKTKSRIVKDENGEMDFTVFFEECVVDMPSCSYLTDKKIDKELQEKFGIGYCEDWISPNTSEDMRQYVTSTPRVVIPITKNSYAALYSGDNTNIAAVQRVGEPTLFNASSIYEGEEPLFVVENEIDALSIIECGYDAVSFGGLSNTAFLIESIKNKISPRLLIISVANETEEEQSVHIEFKARFEEVGQDFIVYNLANNDMSINDMLIKDKQLVNKSIEAALKKATEYELDKIKDYQKINSNIEHISNFRDGASKNIDNKCISTEFKNLDKALEGGIYEGLYILTSDVAFGKTSFAIQLADNIAAHSKDVDVLMFLLDSSRDEIMAKSISRITAEISLENKYLISNAKTLRGVSSREMYEKYNEKEKKLIKDACIRYEQSASNIYVFECGNVNASYIREAIEEHIQVTSKAGRRILAIVDCIGELSDYDEKDRDEAYNTFLNIKELKRICRDNKVTILGVSEIQQEVSSSCDVEMYLYAVDSTSEEQEVSIERRTKQMDMRLEILKNRNGLAGSVLEFEYYPQFSYFKPVDGDGGTRRGKYDEIIPAEELVRVSDKTLYQQKVKAMVYPDKKNK